jgi:hypothetical protein
MTGSNPDRMCKSSKEHYMEQQVEAWELSGERKAVEDKGSVD